VYVLEVGKNKTSRKFEDWSGPIVQSKHTARPYCERLRIALMQGNHVRLVAA